MFFSPSVSPLRRQVREASRLGPRAMVHFFEPLLVVAAPDVPSSRDRLYTSLNIFWLFLAQVLTGNGSCRRAVRRALSWLGGGGARASANTAAYCKARARLPIAWLESVLAATRSPKPASGDKGWRWHGLRVLVVDGTSARAPDTPANQAAWPQPKTQKPGCGFPVVHLVAAFDLGTGCLEHVREGRLYEHERELFASMRAALNKGDVVLADRGLCSFAEFHELTKAGLHAVMRKNARLHKGLVTVRRLGPRERIARWHRSAAPSRGYTREQWKALPATMLVREIEVVVTRPGFRTQRYVVLTTLLDTKAHKAADFAELYHRRWQAELHFDEIKTAMGMNELRCKSPAMVRRELLVYLIAYNLVRLAMLKTAIAHHVPIERLSFTGTLHTIDEWLPAQSAGARARATWKELMRHLASDLVPERPGRREPRATKRRQGTYAILTAPRHVYKELLHKGRYRKEATPSLS